MLTWILLIGGFVVVLAVSMYMVDAHDEAWRELGERFGLSYDEMNEHLEGINPGIPVRIWQFTRRRSRKRRLRQHLTKRDWRTAMTAELERRWDRDVVVRWRDRDSKTAQASGGAVRSTDDEEFDRLFMAKNRLTRAVRDTLIDDGVKQAMLELAEFHDQLETLEIADGKLHVQISWKLDKEEEIPRLIEAVVDVAVRINEVYSNHDPEGQGAERVDEYADRDFFGEFA